MCLNGPIPRKGYSFTVSRISYQMPYACPFCKVFLHYIYQNLFFILKFVYIQLLQLHYGHGAIFVMADSNYHVVSLRTFMFDTVLVFSYRSISSEISNNGIQL